MLCHALVVRASLTRPRFEDGAIRRLGVLQKGRRTEEIDRCFRGEGSLAGLHRRCEGAIASARSVHGGAVCGLRQFNKYPTSVAARDISLLSYLSDGNALTLTPELRVSYVIGTMYPSKVPSLCAQSRWLSSDADADNTSEDFDQGEIQVSSQETPKTVSIASDIVRDRPKLEAETRRLLDLMDSAATGNAEPSEELSRTALSEFDRVMKAWSKWHEVSPDDGFPAAEWAESLLIALEGNRDRLMEVSDASVPAAADGARAGLAPNAVSYNLVLHAYAVGGGGREAADRAQAILERMLRRCREHLSDRAQNDGVADGQISPPPEPTTISFNTVINAWAKSGDRRAGSRAEAVYKMMEEWHYDCEVEKNSTTDDRNIPYSGCLPNVRSLSGVIDAWANSKAGKSGADRVRTILDHLVDECRRAVSAPTAEHGDVEAAGFHNDPVIKPNVILFNSVINALAKSGQGARGAEMAENMINMMEDLRESGELGLDDESDIGLKPNARTFSLVLEAWAKSALEVEDAPDAARRADAILTRMEALYAKGYDVKPNFISFTACITAWARCKNFHGAAEKAESILDRMIDLYESSGDDDIKPNTSTFNSVITAWARSGRPDGAQRAEAILDRLESFGSSDTTSYNAVIDAVAKSGESGAGEKAAALLERMEKLGLRPDLITYNSTLDALAKDDDIDSASKADLLLQRLEKFSDDGNSELGPNSMSFTSCINAYSRGSEPRKAEKARGVLQRMIDRNNAGNQDVLPDIFAYSACLHACANSSGDIAERRDALKIAIRTFEELKQSPQYGKPNVFTYGAMIKASSRLSSDHAERGRLLESVFRECCKEGYVSRRNLEQFQRSAPTHVKRKLLGSSGAIPREWCRNVRERDCPF